MPHYPKIVLLMVTLTLIDCRPKAEHPTDRPPYIIRADTSRNKLVYRADSAKAALTILHQRNKNTTDYENSAAAYDSIRVLLP